MKLQVSAQACCLDTLAALLFFVVLAALPALAFLAVLAALACSCSLAALAALLPFRASRSMIAQVSGIVFSSR